MLSIVRINSKVNFNFLKKFHHFYNRCKEPFPVNCGVFCGKAGKNCLEPMIGLGKSIKDLF